MKVNMKKKLNQAPGTHVLCSSLGECAPMNPCQEGCCTKGKNHCSTEVTNEFFVCKIGELKDNMRDYVQQILWHTILRLRHHHPRLSRRHCLY